MDGRYSKYTLMIMTYESRLRLARLAVRHYSRCPSVGEVVIVWNAGEVRMRFGTGQAYGYVLVVNCCSLTRVRGTVIQCLVCLVGKVRDSCIWGVLLCAAPTDPLCAAATYVQTATVWQSAVEHGHGRCAGARRQRL